LWRAVGAVSSEEEPRRAAALRGVEPFLQPIGPEEPRRGLHGLPAEHNRAVAAHEHRLAVAADVHARHAGQHLADVGHDLQHARRPFVAPETGTAISMA
jgi:hypothetical protein